MENQRISTCTFNKTSSRPLVINEFVPDKTDLVLGLDDIKYAESEGYNKGFQEGLEFGISQGELNATQAKDAIVQEILSRIDQSLKAIRELETLYHENFFPNILRICLSVLENTMPHFFHEYGKKEMENFLHNSIESLIVRTPIKIEISEPVYEDMLERLRPLCSAYPETIDIIADPNLTRNSCEIKWSGGGAKWSLDESYHQIKSSLKKHFNTHAAQGE